MSEKVAIASKLVEYNKPLEFVRVPIQDPGIDEVLIKLEFVGLCYGDIEIARGDFHDEHQKLPITLGHEGIGHIVTVGSNVKTFQAGDRVATNYIKSSCQKCVVCSSGLSHLCPKMQFFGLGGNDGVFQEYLVTKADFCIQIPKKVSSTQATHVTCSGVAAYSALKKSSVQKGQWVVLMGASGGVGSAAIQYAKSMGMNVIGVVRGKTKSDFVKTIGCDVAIDSETEDVVAKINEITNGGADGVLLLAPVIKHMNDAIGSLKPRGTVVVVATPLTDYNISAFSILQKEVIITGAFVGTPADVKEAFDIADLGKVNTSVNIYDFKDINKAIADLSNSKVTGKIVLDVSKLPIIN